MKIFNIFMTGVKYASMQISILQHQPRVQHTISGLTGVIDCAWEYLHASALVRKDHNPLSCWAAYYLTVEYAVHCIENDSAEFKILLKLFPIVSGRARNHAPNLEIHSVFCEACTHRPTRWCHKWSNNDLFRGLLM